MTTQWKAKHRTPKDFLKARNGDALLTPFEYDVCVFRKLRGSNPLPNSQQDKFLLSLIRRANLDAFWSRARSTVAQNLSKVKMMLQFSKNVGLEGPFESSGPYPTYDHCGYELAIAMLQYSRRSGKHSVSHTQHDTFRKLKSAYGNWVRASAQANSNTWVVSDTDGKLSRVNKDISGSLWFHRFNLGVKFRMGSIWKPNKGFSTNLLKLMLQRAEKKRIELEDLNSRHIWTVFSTYSVISYTLSLRGAEGFLLDLKGTRKNRERRTEKHFWITLLGKLKGEHLDRQHHIPCTLETSSGLRVEKAVERLLREKERLGWIEGPAIANSRGELYSASDLDCLLHEVLEELFDEDKTIFPPDIKTKENLIESYHCFRSFRRASDTRAMEMKVAVTDIEIVNRWGQEQRSKHNSKINMPMRQHYAQPELLIAPFLRYTTAM